MQTVGHRHNSPPVTLQHAAAFEARQVAVDRHGGDAG